MIDSPCINICQMDPATALCRGCFRTLDEITRWSRIDDAGQIVIVANAARRRQEHDPWEGELRGDCDR